MKPSTSETDLEAVFAGKEGAADVAGQRLGTGVDLHVVAEGALDREPLVALGALVRLLASMRPSNAQQISILRS